MPEFIPLSLILQAHTIPAIKKTATKTGTFYLQLFVRMKNNAFTIHCKVGKGTFFGRKQGAEKYGEKNIRHLVKNTRHLF